MKKIKNLFVIIAMIGLGGLQTYAANEVDGQTTEPEVKIEVLYFHATRRCVTCQAIEKVAKKTVIETYGDKVSFKVFNREQEANKELVQKYKISGQTLLIVKGDEVVNLTTEAFMNARTNPEKFIKKLKSCIDSLI